MHLSSMAGLAVGIYIATTFARRSTTTDATGSEQKDSIVWPKGTTRALGITLLASAIPSGLEQPSANQRPDQI
jgi:hypothetical protein